MSYIPERRFQRVEFQKLNWVFSLQAPQAAATDRPLRLEARNISQGGLKFHSNRRFDLFAIIQVHLLELPTGKVLAAPQGKVVRVEEIDTGFGERTYGIALEFMSGTDGLRSLPGPTENPSPPAK